MRRQLGEVRSRPGHGPEAGGERTGVAGLGVRRVARGSKRGQGTGVAWSSDGSPRPQQLGVGGQLGLGGGEGGGLGGGVRHPGAAW